MTADNKPIQHATTGRFVRTPEQIANDRRAADYRSLGYTYQMIADRFDVSVKAAHRMVQRAVEEIPTEGAEEVRKIELEKIDNTERYYQSVIMDPPYRIGNNGKVVEYEQDVRDKKTGNVERKLAPVIDEGVRMDAAAGILKAQAQRAKLLGLNAPVVTRGEVVIYDVERDTALIIEAQTKALKAMGLDNRIEEFRNIFVSALGFVGGDTDADVSIEAVVVSEH